MKIAAKVWSWVGTKATETARFGDGAQPTNFIGAPVAKVMPAIADGRLIRVQISLRC